MAVKGLDVKARWFAGKGRTVSALAVADTVPVTSGRLELADVTYADGGQERYLLADDLSWLELLRRVREGPLETAGGQIELRGDPELPTASGDEPAPATDQTNTLAVLDGAVLVKAYRRLEPGVHPEIELLGALTEADSPVPALLGSLHHVNTAGEDTALALLQEFVPDAEAGWEDPIERVARYLRGEGEAPVREYRAAGRTAAEVHAALARRLGGSTAGAAEAMAAQTAAMSALEEAAASDAGVAAVRTEVEEALRGLQRLAGSPLQRIHGDLHFAQFLRPRSGSPSGPGPRGLLVIDFEGDPTLSLEARRRPGSALHDLACLARSIDHIGSAASRRAGGADPGGWIAAATAAALEAYGRVDGELLRALEIAKECGEFVYAQRVLPRWSYAPRQGLSRLLEAGRV